LRSISALPGEGVGAKLGNVEPLDDITDAQDRIRRCGTVDTEFFAFLEWLDEQPERMESDEAGDSV
jgi:hypothetical protein